MAWFILLANHTHAKDWSFQIEPYVMGTTIEGDASIGRVTGADVDVDFGDILEVLDIAAMAHFEAHHTSGWGVVLDYGFMVLRDDLAGPRDGVVGAKLRQGVLEALLVRRVQSGGGQLDFLAGMRWWDNDIDVTVDPSALPGTAIFEVEEDWVDLVVGARWAKPLNDSWTFQLRGDLGGLGLESDFTASVSTGVHYQLNKLVTLDLLYKATWVDFEAGTAGQAGYFAYDTVTHGPILGCIFNF